MSLSGTTTVLRLFGFGTSRQPTLRLALTRPTAPLSTPLEVAPWEEIG